MTTKTHQTFTRNGITIQAPVGYASLKSFKAVLEINLGIMERSGKKYAHLIPRTKAQLAQIALALA